MGSGRVFYYFFVLTFETEYLITSFRSIVTVTREEVEAKEFFVALKCWQSLMFKNAYEYWNQGTLPNGYKFSSKFKYYLTRGL